MSIQKHPPEGTRSVRHGFCRNASIFSRPEEGLFVKEYINHLPIRILLKIFLGAGFLGVAGLTFNAFTLELEIYDGNSRAWNPTTPAVFVGGCFFILLYVLWISQRVVNDLRSLGEKWRRKR